MLVEAFVRRIEIREREVERQFSFLRRLFTPRSVFLHYGAGDCALALQAASYVERVYAVGVAEGVTDGVRLPVNLRLVDPRELWMLGDGAVDVSFSERLPVARLRDLYKCLAPRGVHVFPSCNGFRELARGAGFVRIRTHWLANLLHQPKLMSA